MLDYEKIYTYGESGKFINTVIEIPKNSTTKVEFDRGNKTFIVDRVEPAIFIKPANYGFIPQTTDEDGDPLDTLVITEEPLTTGLAVKARVVGVLDFEDGGANDYKIICVLDDDRTLGNSINNLDDINEQLRKQIEFHFNHYKDLKKPGTTLVRGWGDIDRAWQIIEDCSSRYKSG